ncbi:MAG: Xaa-Pro peptidase family protein [Clostridia bacterium]|nr:Xaa-Pro peptidase family protein [Clostridia bacterium]MCD8295028.1 Xaa-Pro peptidase family protein [Clostridia bacterium]
MNRAEKIFAKASAEHKPDAIVLTGDDVRFYATGFYSTDGYVIIEKDRCILYVDDRYLEAAARDLAGKPGMEVRRLEPVKKILRPYKRIALPLERITLKDFLELRDGKEVSDCTAALEQSMAIKDADELDKIKKASEITDDAYLKLLPRIKEGMSENDCAAELEYLMRLGGASGPSFDTIVCFGEGSSVPHHETSQKKLRFGDVVLIDFGCKWGGYCSDCTRTFLFGDDGRHAIFKSMYAAVLEAHNLVKQEVVAGMSCRAADGVARKCLKKYGLDKLFTHSLGHGIGVNIHEKPTLSPRTDMSSFLENGMVFSDEPGVYLEGEFGIRIEDSVYLENGTLKSLSKTDKSLLIL